MLLCDLYLHFPKRLEISTGLAWTLVFAALFLGGFRNVWLREAVPALSFIGEKGMRWWDSAGAVLLISACLFAPRALRALQTPIFTRLGALSFPLYLCHFPLLCSLGLQTFLLAGTEFSLGHHASAGIASVVTLAASLACSWVLHHVADRPSIELGRRLSTAVGARPPSSASAAPDKGVRGDAAAAG